MDVLLFLFVFEGVCTKRVISNAYFSKDSTGVLRGITIIAIAFAHICQAQHDVINSLVGGKYSYYVIFSWGGIGVAVFFLLSGYGCYLSISKTDNSLKWMVHHVVKMLLYFVIAYTFVVLIRIGILKEEISVNECLICFFTLKLPGTSSWYFKIQILFYILLAISNAIKKNQCYLVTAFVVIYASVAALFGLPDYWWKTSLCFAVGCYIAIHKDSFLNIVSKIQCNIILIVLGMIAFVYIRKDYHYYFLPQLIAYVLISLCIVTLWNSVGGESKLFNSVGKASLAVYLIHIGIVDTVYGLNSNLTVKSIIFVALVLIGSVITHRLAEGINNALLTKTLK